MTTETIPLVTLDESNLEREHICCAIADKKCAAGYEGKKALIRARLRDGFVFRKLDVRGKVFIEYVPAERAWAPVVAPGYTFIHCAWVSGQFKGQGLGRRLVEACIADSRGKAGLCVVTPKKARPFLTDPRFFTRFGFEVADEAPPEYQLLALKLKAGAPSPRFADSIKRPRPARGADLVVYWSKMCPFTDHYVDEVLRTATEHGLTARGIEVTSAEEAQRLPCPTSIFGAFLDGQFLTHEVLNRGRLEKLLAKVGRI